MKHVYTASTMLCLLPVTMYALVVFQDDFEDDEPDFSGAVAAVGRWDGSNVSVLDGYFAGIPDNPNVPGDVNVDRDVGRALADTLRDGGRYDKSIEAYRALIAKHKASADTHAYAQLHIGYIYKDRVKVRKRAPSAAPGAHRRSAR